MRSYIKPVLESPCVSLHIDGSLWKRVAAEYDQKLEQLPVERIPEDLYRRRQPRPKAFALGVRQLADPSILNRRKRDDGQRERRYESDPPARPPWQHAHEPNDRTRRAGKQLL